MASITCGKCRQTHSSVSQVRACYYSAGRQGRSSFEVETSTVTPVQQAPRAAYPEPTHEDMTVVGLDQVPEGTYTVQHLGGSYRTYRLQRQALDATFKPGVLLVSKLTGKDNEADYTTIGHLVGSETLRVWKHYRESAHSIRNDLRVITRDPRSGAKEYALVSGKCWRCGHTLTTPESIARGFGPKCAARAGW